MTAMSIEWLNPLDPNSVFPPVEKALNEPDGLLAAGGDLNPGRVLRAYREGIFPWYEEGQPILWWSPNPRAVLYPNHLKISRSLRKTLRNHTWTISFDRAFRETIKACAAPRKGIRGTWITPSMLRAYCLLHAQGYAHSVEVWDETGALIGGLYGVAIGRVYFGESMFSRKPDTSKVALTYLARHLQAWGYPLIDCQLSSPHITSLGGEALPRKQYLKHLKKWCAVPGQASPWHVDPELKVRNWRPQPSSRPAVR
jgi:leucyl/phenylalanyl-tRNA--protein transferase